LFSTFLTLTILIFTDSLSKFH